MHFIKPSLTLMCKRRKYAYLFSLFWIHLSPYFVASEPNDLITKCGNGVPTAKISMGTPFPGVPTGN